MTEEEAERQLSRLFHAAAGDPPGYVSLSGIRRLVVRRRIVMSVTAAAAIVLAGFVGLAVSAEATGMAPASGSGPAAGQPRYYFEEGIVNLRNSPGFKQQDVIRASATGAITGTVRCPWRHSYAGEAAVAAPDRVAAGAQARGPNDATCRPRG